MMELIELPKYESIELVLNSEPIGWGILMKIKGRKSALMCSHGKVIQFDTRKKANKYIKEMKSNA